MAEERVDGTEGRLDLVDDFRDTAVSNHVLGSVPGAERCGKNTLVSKESAINSRRVHLDKFGLSCSGLLHRFACNRVESCLAGCGEARDLGDIVVKLENSLLECGE